MICLRCGYCCSKYSVMVVDDPSLGIIPGNIIHVTGQDGPCKHLTGEGPGKYSCAIHNYPWFVETPCHDFDQIGPTDSPCMLGRTILKIEDSK